MASIVRVKRLLDEEPLDQLILSCKRKKLDGKSDTDEYQGNPTILKLVATVENREEDVFKHIQKPTKLELEESFKKHKIELSSKLREETQAKSRLNRYKVINSFRSKAVESAEDKTSDTENTYTILDVELEDKEIYIDNSKNPQYVYDLYYTNSDDLGSTELNEFISVYPLSDNLIYGSHRDNGINHSDSYDSEDSNAENDWRNDYPDESDMESVTEDDMIRAVQRVTLDGESDLSSDKDDEDLLYNNEDSDDACLEDLVDEEDVRKYGRVYARFRARAKRLEEPKIHNPDLYYGDIDNEYDD